jgi:hypothetical protein
VGSDLCIRARIFFNTLHFFVVLGRFTRGASLAYPGRVIPVMHPKADGKPGRAKISVTGFDAPRPSVVVEYVERDGRKGEARLDIPKIAVDRPQTLAATVRAGRDGIERLDLRIKVDTEKDERDVLIQRTADERVDRTILSAEQAGAVFANLSRLRAAGLYPEALAYHDLGGVRVTIGWEHESKPATEVVATLDPNGSPAPFPDITKLLPDLARRLRAEGASASLAEAGRTTSPAEAGRLPVDGARGRQPSDPPLVQWDTPIPPPEAYEILAKMSTFKEANVYKVGQTYLGKDVWAMDLMPPVAGSHWSHAKQTTMKPTIVYSARQHANEVSSTSHVLRLAELLLTDPVYREKLNKVNVVIHPITNPDGAQLAYDLQKINPTYMLHAGYLGSLGVDVTNAQWDPDPLYPESGIRPKIWRTWLPDIFLNPHGYPTHEWVQLFSEYARGPHALGRNPRLLDDARLVDAGLRMAGRRAIPAAQGRADEAAEHDHAVREGGASDRRAQRARLRTLQTIQLRFRPEELQARFHGRRADLQGDQRLACQPAEPRLHDAPAERHHLGGRHGSAG